jgi:MSHA biogenesis protein MshE
MGAAGYMIAAALHGIVAQRLVRRVCDNCAQPTAPDAHQEAWLHAQVGVAQTTAMIFKAGAGCTYCNLSGYRGRVAVYELLELDRGLADFVRCNDAIRFSEAARKRSGYVSLTRAALQLASEGVTSLAEAIGVTSGLEETEDSLLDEALSAESVRLARDS